MSDCSVGVSDRGFGLNLFGDVCVVVIIFKFRHSGSSEFCLKLILERVFFIAEVEGFLTFLTKGGNDGF